MADAVALSTERTSTGVAVIAVSDADNRPLAVVKIPMTSSAAHRLEREGAVLAMLQQQPRLGTWRTLVPRPLAEGTLSGQPYRVETGLGGRRLVSGLGTPASRLALLNVAAETIDVLHRATASPVVGDADVIERWVEVPLRELTRALCRDRLGARLRRLRDELRDAVLGQRFRGVWIHGDYWVGNMLFSSNGAAPGMVEGIVDWDASGPGELPLHDLLHLVVSTRVLATGQQLGRIVRDQLLRGEWRPEEQLLLERRATWLGSLSPRHALLLYWLRHVALHIGQQDALGGFRYRWWQHLNVVPVLEALWP